MTMRPADAPAPTPVFPEPREPAHPAAPHTEVLPRHFAGHWARLGSVERLRLIDRLEDDAAVAPDRRQPFPLVEEDPRGDDAYRAVTFLHWNAGATAVVLSANALLDDLNVGWHEFEPLPGSLLWALTYRMPHDWEAGYRITAHCGPGPAPWQLATGRRGVRIAADAGGPDELNPVESAGMNGAPVSVVRLPGAPAAPWLAAATPDAKATSPVMGGSRAQPSGGSSTATGAVEGLDELHFDDDRARRRRTVWVYRPPGGEESRPANAPATPLLLLHDGQVWARYLRLHETLDRAISEGVIPPLHVAMIDSVGGATRAAELGGPVGTVDFIAEDLLPWLRSRLEVTGQAGQTIVSGASYGGLASLWQLARFPDLVGAAVAQSPSLWRYDLAEPVRRVADRVAIRLQAGIYEADIHDATRRLVGQLRPLGADVGFTSITGGHDWVWWNPWLVRGLADLLGPVHGMAGRSRAGTR